MKAPKEVTLKKYKLIVDSYFANGFNGVIAVQSQYPNYNEVSASTLMHEIRRIPQIEIYIDEKYEYAQTHLKTTHESVLDELKNWAYSDITETILLSPYEVKELPKDIRRLITSYKHEKKIIGDITIETIELKFVSKEKAMEMIQKHIGFYEKDNKQKTEKDNPQIVLPDGSIITL